MRIFVSLFFITLFVFSFVFYLFYLKEHSKQELKLSKQAKTLLHDSSLILQEELAHLNGDIFYITSLYNKKYTSKTPITNELLDFMHYKTNYKGLHIFDTKGDIHLSITSQNDTATLQKTPLKSPKIEDKYIQKALSLHEEEILISKIYAQEDSSQTLFHIASPLFDKYEKKQGILVLDISLELALQKLVKYSENNKLKIYIANHNGAWIFAPDIQAQLPKNTNEVMQKSSHLWEKMQRYETGTVLASHKRFHYKYFNPMKDIQHYNILHKELHSSTLMQSFSDKELQLTLIIECPKDTVGLRTFEYLSKLIPYFLFGIFVTSLFGFLLIRFLQERFNTMTQLRLAASYFDHSEDGMVITDPTTKIIKVNKRYTAITGFSQTQLLGQKTNILASGWTPKQVYIDMWSALHTNSFWEGEITDRRQDGSIHSQWLRIIALRDKKNKIINFLGLSTDITERKESKETIKKLAYRDPLTGLANKILFKDRLLKAIEVAKRYNKKIGLLFIDLDDFKQINEVSGHYVGDMFLIEIAKTLKKSIRQSDTLARFGGDEFVILLEDYERTDIVALNQRILSDLKEPIVLNTQQYFPSASIGIAVFPDDAKDDVELLQHADTAMYRAKESGKSDYCFYQPDMNIALNSRLIKENHLKGALLKDELYLHFQPQISLQENKVIGVEALLRWHNPDLGLVAPDNFIHIAESLGLIIPFTDFVFNSVCEAIKHFDTVGLSEIKVAVNISSLHLKKENFVLSVQEIITKNDIDPKRIELEITEGALMEDIQDSIIKLETLRSLGFSIAIDDFGTGYSSLAYLKKFNFDKLKIDREFVHHLPTDLDDISIIKAIIAVAKALNMQLIAEGAETEENIKFLELNGCDLIQGYFFSKPLSLDACVDFIKDFKLK